MDRSEMAVERLSKEEVTTFYRIVREELEKENITWDMFCGRTLIAPIKRARHNVVWRIRLEIDPPLKVICDLVNLSETTVKRMLKNMYETNGTHPKKIIDKLSESMMEYRP